jgi:uncharacterized membrane protein (UPF0127 family)/Skp family chaperone for outer membrane proteins
VRSNEKTSLFVIAVLIAGIFSGVTCAQDAPSKVAIVNIRQVFSNMQETIDFHRQFLAMQSQFDSTARTHQAKLKDLQGSDMAAFDQQSLQFQVDEQAMKTKMVRAQSRQLESGYDQIKSVITNLAKSKNLDLVLIDSGVTLPDFGNDNISDQTLASLFFNRTAVFTSDRVDLTNDVIAILNKNYKGATGAATAPALPTIPMKIGSKTFQIEIAADDASREHGLMERDSLPSDHGMIFVFDEPQEQHFWMHHTRFPLDIIFVDSHQKIISISTMKAYDEHNTDSNGPAKYAIELPIAAAAASGVKPGDQVHIPPQVDAALK